MPVHITVATRKYSDYILSPDLTETAVQDAIPTESYGNFGLAAEQGEGLGDVGVVPGREVLRGEREVVVGRDADAVDELVVSAELVLCGQVPRVRSCRTRKMTASVRTIGRDPVPPRRAAGLCRGLGRAWRTRGRGGPGLPDPAEAHDACGTTPSGNASRQWRHV